MRSNGRPNFLRSGWVAINVPHTVYNRYRSWLPRTIGGSFIILSSYPLWLPVCLRDYQSAEHCPHCPTAICDHLHPLRSLSATPRQPVFFVIFAYDVVSCARLSSQAPFFSFPIALISSARRSLIPFSAVRQLITVAPRPGIVVLSESSWASIY